MTIFSIIIINYKTKELTAQCITSILQFFDPQMYEIIVIDNASEDGSVEKLKKEFGEKIKVIENSKNSGFGAANNLGAMKATGQYLLFLNSDTIIEQEILSEAKGFLESNPRVAIMSPRLKLVDGSNQPDTFGLLPSPINIITNKLIFSKKVNEKDKIEWVSGAAMIIRRNVFIELGGFDDGFFMYFEDMDLCKRALGKDYQIALDPVIEVTHLVAKSSKDTQSIKRLYYKSQDYYFTKHYGIFIAVLVKMLRKIFILCK